MKKLMMMAAVAMMAFGASAASGNAVVGGITWYYNTITEGGKTCAEITRISDKDKEYSGDLMIPSTLDDYPVTSIGKTAFDECDFKSVTIPSGVTSIGDYAFCYCDKLTSVTIPSTVTSIEEGAFAECSGLKSVTIPSSVKSIGYAAFAFSGLRSVTIPASVTSIGTSAFACCSELTAISVDARNAKYCSVDGLLYSKDKKTLVAGLNKKNVTILSDVTSIGDYAFCYCDKLTSITIPSGVTSIGVAAFSYSGLTSVTIPSSVTSIGMAAFAYCGLKSVTIPSSVKSIEDYTFQYCSELKSVTIPSSVTSIGKCAFEACSSLTSVTIPSSVTSIGRKMFEGCSSLASVTIPSSVKSIGDYAFDGCSNLIAVYVDTVDDAWVKGLYSWPGNVTFVTADVVQPLVVSDSGCGMLLIGTDGYRITPDKACTSVKVLLPKALSPEKVTVEVTTKVRSLYTGGAKVEVLHKDHDIAPYIDLSNLNEGGVIDLTKVTVKESVVKGVLKGEAAIINLSTAYPLIRTAPTIPGLTYTFSEGQTLDALRKATPKTKDGDGNPWEPTITVKGGNSAFYAIGVIVGE